MGKIDYRAIEDLQGQVSSHYNSISEATATISSIDAKLANSVRQNNLLETSEAKSMRLRFL